MTENNKIDWKKWFSELRDKTKRFLQEESLTTAGSYINSIVDKVSNTLYNAVRCWNEVKLEDNPVRIVVCVNRMIIELERVEEVARHARKELEEVMEYLMAVYNISEEDIEEEILREMEEEDH